MLDIFDILGPVMVGPSSSHTAGAVRIGRMARTLLDAKPVRAEIGLYGSFAETGRGHGTDRALVAGLLGMAPDNLDVPGSFRLAAEQGLAFSFRTVQLRDAHPNTAVLDVTAEDGRRLVLRAASTGGGGRLSPWVMRSGQCLYDWLAGALAGRPDFDASLLDGQLRLRARQEVQGALRVELAAGDLRGEETAAALAGPSRFIYYCVCKIFLSRNGSEASHDQHR